MVLSGLVSSGTTVSTQTPFLHSFPAGQSALVRHSAGTSGGETSPASGTTVGTHCPFWQAALGGQGALSSTCPLQSLSAPSQTSGVGVRPLHSPHRPPAHCCVPGPQGVVQGRVRSPSSMSPSQLLSWPSHTSDVGRTCPWHDDHCPPWHTCAPLLQTPVPAVPGGPR